MDKSSMSYWFPLIEAAGLPVPKTRTVEVARSVIWDWFNKELGYDASTFFRDLGRAANQVGFPCFLRSGHTSDKHRWKDTCYIESPSDLRQHVYNIIEFSCCHLAELPFTSWNVREMLPTIPHGNCLKYGGMPVCKEFRFFVKDGKVECFHPYWPLNALTRGGWTESDYDRLCAIEDEPELRVLAERAAAAVGGAFSVDILETKLGWYVTDMAEAEKSFHLGTCERLTA